MLAHRVYATQPESRWDLDNIASCSLYSGATFVTSIQKLGFVVGNLGSCRDDNENLESEFLSLKIIQE